MKFGFTIWHNYHFQNIEKVVAETQDIVDYYIITTMPFLFSDNSPIFSDDGISDYIPKLQKAFRVCKQTKQNVGIQIIPTPKDSRRKTPSWWQGWVWFSSKHDWNLFFGQFQQTVKKHVDFGQSEGADFYLVGAELTSTLSKSHHWQTLFSSLKQMTSKPLGYSHHFSLPLKYYYRWELFFAVVIGWFFKRDRIYAELLSKFLVGDFSVPDDQKIQVAKNLYQTANANFADMDFVKLNDYFWYVMNQRYDLDRLEKNWESIRLDGHEVKFMSAVRSWIKQYRKGRKVWIENDLNMGYVESDDEYYQQWWEIFLRKHADIADVVVTWEQSHWGRWAKIVKRILRKYQWQ